MVVRFVRMHLVRPLASGAVRTFHRLYLVEQRQRLLAVMTLAPVRDCARGQNRARLQVSHLHAAGGGHHPPAARRHRAAHVHVSPASVARTRPVSKSPLRDEPSPVFLSGWRLRGAVHRRLRPPAPLADIRAPVRNSSYLGDSVLALPDCGFTARTPEVLARLERAARESGRPFPSILQPGQMNAHDSIWVAR